jgi:hypothetical protein
MKTAGKPFRFYTRQNLTHLTGKKAANLRELLTGIKEASDMCIYYHTHHYLEQHEFLSPEPPNDFAYWITNVLQNKLLGEEIAGLDLRQFSTLDEIKTNIIERIEFSLNGNSESGTRAVPPGEEFHFMYAQTFIFPTEFIANNLNEFNECVKKVSINSVFYHVFESRFFKRIPGFCEWLKELGEDELSDQVCKLDPYTQTMDNLRKMLIALVETRIRYYSNG